MLRYLCSVIIAIAIAVLAGQTASAQEKIKIGLIDMYSGPYAFPAEAMRTGFMIAVDEANAAGGMNGRKFEVVTADMGTQVDKAVNEARRMMLEEKIRFVTVGIHSGAAVAVSALSKEHKSLLSVGFATTRRFTGEAGHPLVARATPTSVELGRVAAAFFKTRPEIKRISVINPDYEYGHHWMHDFTAHLKVVRPDIVIVRQEWPRLGTTDFGPHVTALQAQPVDVVVVNVTGTDLINLLRSAKEFGLFNAKTSAYLVAPDLVRYAGIRDLIPENTYAQLWYPHNAVSTEASRRFATEVEKRMKSYPTASASAGYAAGKMVTEAIRKAGSADDAEAVAKALSGIQFDSPTGAVYVRACDNMAMTNIYSGRLKRDPSAPDGVGVIELQTYQTKDVARSCDEVLASRSPSQK